MRKAVVNAAALNARDLLESAVFGAEFRKVLTDLNVFHSEFQIRLKTPQVALPFGFELFFCHNRKMLVVSDEKSCNACDEMSFLHGTERFQQKHDLVMDFGDYHNMGDRISQHASVIDHTWER